MAITPLPTPPSRSAPSTFSTLADAFLGALPTFVTEANAQAAALELNDTTDASASSAAIGTGAKTFVVTAGKSFQPGMSLMIADDAAPSTNWMHGQVTSYSGTTLVMNITAIGGSGTKTAWIITFSAPTGLPTATAESDFILSGPSPFSWVKKTLAQVKTILGLGAAAYGGYATAAEITTGTEPAKAIAPDQLALTKYNVGYATAAEITAGTEPAKAIAPDQLALSKYNWPFATAAEITAGTEAAKAIAPDQLALTKYNGDWSFWGIKNLRLIDAHAGDATRVIVNPSAYNIPLLIGEHWHVMTAAVDVDVADDLDTGAVAAGTDYYIYACTDGTTLSFKVSANATNPTGFDAAHSRKIGGFHTLCVAVGTISGHPLTDYAVKDILPASIWDLKHRSKTLVNVGLVYDSKIQKWVDIYLASGTGTNTTSVNGGTISDTRNWMDFVDDGLAVGKRLLTDTEFTSIATGSNEETNITGSADPGTTSGHVDTAGRRMISNIGCEDCCGVVWQWIQDQSYYYYGASPYWGNLPGGKGSSYGQFAADPVADEVDNSDSGGDVKLIAGGIWSLAANAGSRSRATNNYRWYTYSNLGARFVSEPL